MKRNPVSKNHHQIRDYTYQYRDYSWPPIPRNAIPIKQEQKAKNHHDRRKSLH